ncbi:MAG: hypothetical protein AAFO06_06150 [Cyanobacteria bacterium J06597_16]
MGFVILMATFLAALLLSNAVDSVPYFLWAWIHLPSWLLWGFLFSFIAWCMKDEPSV